MKIYFAVTGQQEPAYLSEEKLNLLMSYHYYQKDVSRIFTLVKQGIDVFIDSGAFSAYNSGKEINIDDYCKFILESGCNYYAGLDVLYNEKKTEENQKYMEETYGLTPIPTFHKGESIEYLHRLLDKYDHIALGGLVFSGNMKNYLDAIWREILNHKPTLKVHGFGLTGQEHIANYPWYSVDSSSFKSGKRFGRITLYNKAKKELITRDYNVFMEEWYKLTFDERIKEDTSFIYKYTDTLSAVSYHNFVQNIIDKNIDYNYLLKQTTLF